MVMPPGGIFFPFVRGFEAWRKRARSKENPATLSRGFCFSNAAFAYSAACRAGFDARSKRSAFITLVHAFTKS
ncbi:hypothetical protein ABTK18_19600, partial [Acinetobacter baumannii]